MRFDSRLRTVPALLCTLGASASAQTPGVVDYTPELPPTASWPVFVDVGDQKGLAPTDFKDTGSGRGQAFVDVVGRDPSDPTNPFKVGGPDGLLDLIQANSNSPSMPIGAPPPLEIVPDIGTVQKACLVLRQEADGSYFEVGGILSASSPLGFNMAFPGGSPWGVVSADYDADGDPDLFYPCGGFNCKSPNALMRNGGDGTFENVSDTALDGNPIQASFAAAWLDSDLDGDLDLYVANGGAVFDTFYTGEVPDPTDRLYRNNDDGTFTDVAVAAGTNLRSNSFGAATADLDRDGFTDIAVSCFKHWNKLFYGRGDGTYSFMTPDGHPTYSFTLADLIPIPGSSASPPLEDFAFVPPGMTDEIPMFGRWSMPIEIADFNGDQWLDVAFVCWASQLEDPDPTSAEGALFTHADPSTLYLNRGDQNGDGVGDGDFREVSVEVGFEHIGGAMGMVAGDYNGDGFLDIYVGGGGPNIDTQLEEDYLYINEPTAWPPNFQQDPDQPLPKAFYEVGALVGVYENKFMCHGLTAVRGGDRIDVIVGNGGPAIHDDGQANVYYENNGNEDGSTYNLVDVDLQPTISVPGALGARVDLIRDTQGGAGQVLVREQLGGARFASHNTGPMPFALGSNGVLFTRVVWPSGVHQGRLLWPAPAPDTITMVEPDVSMELRPSYPSGGGVQIDLEVKTFNPTGVLGQLFYAVLIPDSSGVGFTMGFFADVGDPTVVSPGSPMVAGTFLSPLATGLHAVAFVDLSTSEVYADAFWHEAALVTPTPASAAPPGSDFPWIDSMIPATPAWSEPVTISSVSTSLRARTDTVEIAVARVPLVFETIDTRHNGERFLDGGDVLRWDDGFVTFEVRGAFEGTLAFQEGAPVLTAGRPSGCCEVVPDWHGTLVRFSGARVYEVDGVAFSPNGARLSAVPR